MSALRTWVDWLGVVLDSKPAAPEAAPTCWRKPGMLTCKAPVPLEWTHVLPGDAILINPARTLTAVQRTDLRGWLKSNEANLPAGVKFIIASPELGAVALRSIPESEGGDWW